MLFNSFVFAGIFLPALLLLFWLTPKDNWRRAWLLLGSLVFYGYWYPLYVPLLLALVACSWACARLMGRRKKVWLVWVAAFVLLGTLAFFKYAGFLLKVAADVGLIKTLPAWHAMALPLGISFIAFQALGYVVDVYRGDFPAEKRYSIVLLFKAFFPQLIAGPICRAHELMPQLIQRFTFRWERLLSGLAIFSLGLFLKNAFADSLAPLVDRLFMPGAASKPLEAWVAGFGFGSQIYADFWGYSTMAVGLGEMFGITLPVNFCLPYLATSFRDFWRRWHITLSQWLRDYLYIPLGGSHHGTLRTIAALMVTMLLGGLWHGANYTFIIWGGLHGLGLVLEHLFNAKKFPASPAFSSLGWAYTFIGVTVAWIFFRAPDLAQAFSLVKTMFGAGWEFNLSPVARQVFILSIALFVVQIPIEHALQKLRNNAFSVPFAVTLSLWALLAAIVLGAPAAVPFIYFQF